VFDPANLSQIGLWLCFAAVGYAYVGYPLLVFVLSRLFGRKPTTAAPDDLPTVSLLVAAHNEAGIIAARVRNALAADYPADKLEVVIATDGCTDATAAVVREFTDPRVRVIEYPVNRGKSTVLNASIPQLTGEVVMLSDANTFTDPDAVRRLVAHFADPDVGAVCGRLILSETAGSRNADSLYWRYETFLKKCESRLGALLGANGGIYAIRTEVFAPIPANTIVDDFVIPLDARLRTGCRIVYEPAAVAHEETPDSVKAEFHRRARIGAGGFQCVGLLWRLMNPLHGWVSLAFVSHKVLRWVGPFFLAGLFVFNLLLVEQPFYLAALVAQVLFYATAVAMKFVPPTVKVLKPLRLTTMFAGMNAALLLGFWRWAKGIRVGTWQRTERTAPQPA
jgi:cellulose synthase/poly-beta-1,6-N-acetylglucosamine synthase-like glycosyltransferase